MECSKKLLPTITTQQSKLWHLVEGSVSASQSTRGDSGIVCCFAVGALIALLLVLSGRVLARIGRIRIKNNKLNTYLIQVLSVAVQRGNAASVLGSSGNMDYQDFIEAL